MFLRIGDLKLLKIKIMQNDELIYEGMVEDVSDELKNTKYKSAKFDNGYVILDI